MDEPARVRACMRCGNRVHDPDQRTCPTCLAPLQLRTFASEEAYAGFLADRRSHGTYVEPVGAKPRLGYALALGVAGSFMLLVAGAVLYTGLGGGLGIETLASVSVAIVPLGLGAGLFEVARRVGSGK